MVGQPKFCPVHLHQHLPANLLLPAPFLQASYGYAKVPDCFPNNFKVLIVTRNKLPLKNNYIAKYHAEKRGKGSELKKLTCSMRKAFFITFLVLSFAGRTVAQSEEDSLLIARTTWKVTPIKTGIIWKQAHYQTLYGSSQEINLIEIDLNQPTIHLGLEGFADTLLLTSEVASQMGAIAGINGGFFNVKNGGGTTLLKKDGKIINCTTLLDKVDKRTERSNGALQFNNNKDVSIIAGDERDSLWDTKLETENVMVCGPLLLLNQQQIPLGRNPFNDNRHPRSAVGIDGANKLLLITVDGRNAKAHGMTLPELSYFLKVYGAENALNLDGGGSTTMFIRGKGTSGVVNHPSDNKLFDHAGERKVANMILIY